MEGVDIEVDCLLFVTDAGIFLDEDDEGLEGVLLRLLLAHDGRSNMRIKFPY